MVAGGPVNAIATPSGLRFKPVTLKWRAALLFGGQLILVTGGVIVLLVLQHDQRVAVARADTAQRVQVLQAEYFVGMVEAESGLQEYLDTGDATNLTNYHEGLAEVAAVSAKLRLIKTDAAGLRYQQQVFAQAEAWQGYSIRALSPVPFQAPTQNFGDDLFDSYAAAQLRSTAYLETVVAKGSAEEAAGTSREILALAAIGAIAVVTVVAGGALIYRSALRPMGRLIRAANELAAGARTELPPSNEAGEIGDLSRALHAWKRFSEKRTAVLRAMHEVSGRVDRDEIVRMGLERLFNVSEAVEVAVVLVGEAETVITTMTSEAGLQEPISLPPDSPLQVLLGSTANHLGDWRDECWPEAIRRWASERGYGPFTVVPMVSGSKSVGAVAATRSVGRPAFDVVDVSLVEAIAGPLAAAIRVAGLFDEVRAVSAQLDIVNRHKTEFLSSMSHEIRTPLNSILGFADLLVAPGFDTVTPKQARYIANIHASGTHLASLINDALDLAKVESGKAELELERVDVAKLVEEVVAGMQPMAVAAQVELVTSSARPGAIAADRRKLHQVLLNLLSNAIKFTPAEGTVTIVVERTEAALLLTVADTGIGVAVEDQERIFGAFEQVTGANRDGGGTGLGLALSRQYVELHGGRLWLESGIGQGSSFHISLPIGSGASIPASEAVKSPAMLALLQK